MAMVDTYQSPLFYENTLRVERDNNWTLALEQYENMLPLHARQEGKSTILLQSNLGLAALFTVDVIDEAEVSTMMIRLSPRIAHIPKVNEEISGSSNYASKVYVNARTRNNTPVLLPDNCVRVMGEENIVFTLGATWFWVVVSARDPISIQIEIGNMLGFAYID